MKWYALILLCIGCFRGYAQKDEKKIIQFSGVIYDLDSNTVVPYVNINNLTRNQTFSSNYKGYFSFVAYEGDSLVFSSVGYKKMEIDIPQSLEENKFTIILKLKADNIMLPMVRVFPWASTDEFKKDFLTMKFADDDLAIARKNLASENFRILMLNLPRDAAENSGLSFINNHQSLINKNGVQTNPLLNPFAWAAFIKQISEGNKSRSKN
jgi:hypothetical protein